MATVVVTETVVTEDITVTLTVDEARVVADLLDSSAKRSYLSRFANPWLYDLIIDLEKASA